MLEIVDTKTQIIIFLNIHIPIKSHILYMLTTIKYSKKVSL